MKDGQVLAALPVHPAPRTLVVPSTLCVDGLVERSLELSREDLQALAQSDVVCEFRCLEGWSVPDVAWQGVTVAAILDLAGALPQARWIQASAGTYSVPIRLDSARTGLVAIGLDGGELPREHGGPFRLVLSDRVCFTSVKWLDRLELRADPGPNTAATRAAARMMQSGSSS